MTSRSRTDRPTAPPRRPVRTDLRLGATMLGVVIGGNLAWHASDAGLISALARR
jgi:hypothetical protein